MKAIVFPGEIDTTLSKDRLHCVIHVYANSRVPSVRNCWYPLDVTFEQVSKDVQERFAVDAVYFQLPLFTCEGSSEFHVIDWYKSTD